MELMSLHQLGVPGRLAPLDLSLESGQLLGVIGPNGAGKSTLLSALAGLTHYRGELRLQGTRADLLTPRSRARQVGYLPQQQRSAWGLAVEDVVSLGRLPWGDQKKEAIDAALAATGLLELRHKRVERLSGGEQARVWLARLLAGEARLLLADEPLASLDLLQQRRVMQLLREQADAGRGVVLSLHDLSLAARYCDRLCLLRQGRLLAWGTPAEVLTPDLLGEAFEVPVHVDLSSEPPIILAR